MNINFGKFFGQNSSSTVIINGKTYRGRNVRIENNKVYVDGKESSGSLGDNIVVTVNGDCESVSTETGNVNVTGDVKRDVKTMSGDISCGNVGGGASTMSGDITCGKIGGNVSTMTGDINHR